MNRIKGTLSIAMLSLALVACGTLHSKDGATREPSAPMTLMDALQKNPRVQFTHDGHVRVRGFIGDPVYVVDGQPMPDPHHHAFANEVVALRVGSRSEAMSYGPRGSGGVIFIQTRAGAVRT